MQLLEQTQNGEQRRYLYRLIYNRRTLRLFVARNKAGKVTSLGTEAEDPEDQ